MENKVIKPNKTRKNPGELGLLKKKVFANPEQIYIYTKTIK